MAERPTRADRHQRHDTRSLVQSSAVVGIGTALSRLTGFLRVAAIAYALGITTLAGVYSYANETPNIVYELLLGGVLTATLVPQFVKHFHDDDDDATSAVVSVAMLALLAITVLGVVLAPFIVDIYTLRVSGPGREAQQELATNLLRLFMPQMLFYGMTALATSMLQTRRRFAAAAFAPILNNVVVIAMFLALPRVVDGRLTVDRVNDDTGLLLLLGIGTTAGIAAMALVLLPALRAAHVHLRFVPSIKHAAVRTMLRLSGWTVGYVIANQIALWVVLVLANGERGGAFAYLSAYAFFQLPYGLFSVSVMTAVAPDLAAAGGRGDAPAMRHRFARSLRLTLAVIVPAAAVYIALARPIVVALLQRGAFSADDAALVSDTLVAFAAGLPFFSTYLFALRAFYSLSDTRTPFFLNVVENAINIGLALALFGRFGIPGLAAAFSSAYALAAVFTLAVLSRRIGGLQGRGIGTTGGRVLLVSAVGAVAAWAIAEQVGWATTGQAIASVTLGLAVAGILIIAGLWVARVEEVRELVLMVRRRGPAPDLDPPDAR
ncbi:MAG TPA: murein biosynthesis integral membrane protein MurJ [Acidimicrobiia bacterium]|nr:murein biosynthesis integral membrane protein MurJ [Acidimicrobiia bacterium]